MGATGTRQVCGGVTCNTNTICGQGPYQEFWLIYSTDLVTNPTPAWLDASSSLRAFQTRRGRDSELDAIDAGTATFSLDNRTRTFDPLNNALIRPRNQWWLMEQFSGATNPVFKGYAEAYDQTWPARNDAVAVVTCSDELGRLARDALLTTDPPRDTYEDVVEYETPDGFWPFNEPVSPGLAGKALGVEGGRDLVIDGTAGSLSATTATPIQGDQGWELGFINGQIAATDVLVTGDPSVVQGINEFALGFWFQYSAAALGTKQIISGPLDGGGLLTYDVQLTAAGALNCRARNNGGTTISATSAALTTNTWYHVVVTIESGSLRVYLNGVQSAATAFTPPFVNSLSATAKFKVGDATATAQTFHYTQIFTDRTGMTAARVLAQYNAGVNRGYPSQAVDARMISVLDTVQNQAPRNIRAAARNVLPVMQRGQDPLSELQYALEAENVDAMLFVEADGTITFLDSAHRSVSPWNTSQMTFTDTLIADSVMYQSEPDGLDVDYSESYIVNEVNATRPGGVVQTASNSLSIQTYGKHSQSISPPCINDAAAATIAAALLAKYKDPFLRVLAIRPQMQDKTTLDLTMRRDLGDKVTVVRTPPGGGSAISQALWIQRIEHSWNASDLFLQTTLGVSPR